jgi:hypothetical protein
MRLGGEILRSDDHGAPNREESCVFPIDSQNRRVFMDDLERLTVLSNPRAARDREARLWKPLESFTHPTCT